MELFNSELFSDKKIVELEAKIDSIISGFMAAKEENKKLAEKIQILENENRGLKERLTESNGEREKIAEKVKKILDKIEKVEV